MEFLVTEFETHHPKASSREVWLNPLAVVQGGRAHLLHFFNILIQVLMTQVTAVCGMSHRTVQRDEELPLTIINVLSNFLYPKFVAR